MSTPPRPDLTEQPSKPDVLVRLTDWHRFMPLHNDAQTILRDDIADAMNTIAALRETCDRRLATINDLKRLLQRVTLDSEWSCMAADVQADIEAALAGSRPSEGR